MWSAKPSGLPLQREAEPGKALLHTVDQRGDTVMAVALHDRIAVADLFGEGRLEQRLAPARVGLVPGARCSFRRSC